MGCAARLSRVGVLSICGGLPFGGRQRFLHFWAIRISRADPQVVDKVRRHPDQREVIAALAADRGLARDQRAEWGAYASGPTWPGQAMVAGVIVMVAIGGVVIKSIVSISVD